MSGIRMPNASLAQKSDGQQPIPNMLPPNSFPLGQVLRFHEHRIVQLEQQKEESKSELLESKFAILSERMDALTKLCNKLNAKLESNESEEEEDEDNEQEGVVLEVTEH